MGNAVVVEPMKPWRVRLVYAVAAFIVLGHLVDIGWRREHWPFSNYPMFAILGNTRDYSDALLVGVTDDEQRREVPLTSASMYAPQPSFHVRWAFQRADRVRNGRYQKLASLSKDFLNRYNARVAAGELPGPRLKALRLYEVRWRQITPAASNARTPDETVLLFDSESPAMKPMQTQGLLGGAPAVTEEQE